MKIQIEIRRPGWLPDRFRWRTRLAVGMVLLLAVGVPVAWASHDFGDVPTSHPFHSQISALKGAGITTGCGGGNYCPSANVSREAMAAFMHRGYGRAATGSFSGTVGTNYSTPVGTISITPGLPVGALAGAAGFVQGTAQITLSVTNASGCPCRFDADMWMTDAGDGTGYWLTPSTGSLTVRLNETGYYMMNLTGQARVTSGTPKTVQILVANPSGMSAAIGYGNATLSYYPFGSTGTNIESASAPVGPPKPARGK